MMELKASPVPPQFILPAATLSIFNSRINNSIALIPILPSISSSDRIEDVGHRVYLAINELLRAVDAQLFPLIVALNFDYQNLDSSMPRSTHCFQSRVRFLKTAHGSTFTTEIFDLRADVQIFEFKEQLNEESYQPAPFTSSTPSNRTQQITDAIAKETERSKMDSRRQFLKAFDAWELSKKNQNVAVPQLRTLGQKNVKSILPLNPFSKLSSPQNVSSSSAQQ